MNGTTNGDSTIKANDVANNKDQASGKMKDEAGKPSSNLKCLEDPNFSFDDSTTATTAAANLASSESKPSTEAGKKPSYRVLEDPEVNVAKPKTTGYKVGREVKKRNREINMFLSKVLEDPMMTSIYEPAKPDPAKGRPEEVV